MESDDIRNMEAIKGILFLGVVCQCAALVEVGEFSQSPCCAYVIFRSGPKMRREGFFVDVDLFITFSPPVPGIVKKCYLVSNV